MSAPEQDSALMRRIADGDPVAFRMLGDRQVDRLLALASRMLGDRTEAEDVVQECFIRDWKNAERWQPTAAVGTWLHRITYNLCIDRIRARRPTVPIGPIDPPSTAPLADRGIQGQHVARRVQEVLATLPERQRGAIVLVHFQELPAREAAAMMDISIEALESLLARARRALKAALTKEVPDLIGAEP